MSTESGKKGWRDLPIGGIILDAGGAEAYETGSWRSFRPIHDPEKCIHCLRCWAFCPDSAMLQKDGKIVGIDYTHCKGCGICAKECPDKVQAIEMKPESDFIDEEKAKGTSE